jgi:hypothetical protein
MTKGDDLSNKCPHCAYEVPVWWVRGYCANCGGNLPRTPQQVNLEKEWDDKAKKIPS